MELKIENESGLVFWVGCGDLVQVSLESEERAQCRKLLLDALELLNQTIVTRSTFSTAAAQDQFEKRSSPHLSDCLGVYDCAPPIKTTRGQPRAAETARIC